MINCPNPSCKAANPEEAEVCQVCQSVLPHYFLWGVGDLVASLKPGTMLNQRYLLKRDRTFLDTKPGILPESLPEIPDFLTPYLHLSAYPLHVPRPYSVLRTPDKDYVLMLESSALWVATPTEVPTQLPRLINRWADAPPLRQLNWLWQIAHIWDAFAAEQVAATLLDSSLLRVDGSILRLLELASPMPDVGGTGMGEVLPQPTLVDLARSWQPLAESAHQAVRAFLERLCVSLERQQLNAEQLTEQLSLAITVCASGQHVAYDLSVNTDQGPTRKRNEDACFPDSGTDEKLTSEQTKDQPQLLIVCDGIGGHQGGDVASKLAISTIRQQLAPLLSADSPKMTATELSLAIEAAICAANDEISAQNDQAQRQARDRMGTTLVLALVKGAEVYIAHLGDSRAYRISGRDCQQVTLDDDVASRQVRLGGSLYREVLVQPGAGSLIQALGMGPSQSLRPTVQRFVIDESCVFLLCSDGLSDSDRVEQFWQQELKPLVSRGMNDENATAETGLRLVELANRCNGHDNVTVGLLNAQVVRVSDRIVPRDVSADASGAVGAAAKVSSRKGKKKARPTTALQSTVSNRTINSTGSKDAAKASATSDSDGSVEITPGQAQTARLKKKGGSGFKKAGIALVLIALAGGVFYSLFPGLRWRWQSPAANPVTGPDSALPEPTDVSGQTPVARVPVDIKVSAYIRIFSTDGLGISTDTTEAQGSQPASTPTLYPNLERATDDSRKLTSTVSTGSIVQILEKAELDDDLWVHVQLCSSNNLSDPLSDGGEPIDANADTPAPGAEVPPLNRPEAIEEGQPLAMKSGDKGWILEADLVDIARPIPEVEASQKGSCEG